MLGYREMDARWWRVIDMLISTVSNTNISSDGTWLIVRPKGGEGEGSFYGHIMVLYQYCVFGFLAGGRVGFLGFKSLLKLLYSDVFLVLGRPMLP
jgi:hypothetical protein